MSKMLFAIFSCIVVIVLLFCEVQCKKRSSRIGKSVAALLAVGALSVAGYTIIFCTNSYIGMSIGNCIFFAGMDWLCYAMFRYALEYTAFKGKPLIQIDKRFQMVIILILLVDSFSMLLNIIFEQSMKFKEVYYNGDIYLQFVPQSLFYLHLSLCYMLFAASLYLFGRKMHIAPQIYKKEYSYVAATLAGVVIVNALFLIFQPIVDVSIYTYAAAAVMIDYFTFYYMPKNLESYMKKISQDRQKDLLIMFDNEDNFVYMNNNMALFLKNRILSKSEFEEEWNYENDSRMTAVLMKGEAKKIYIKEYERFHDDKNRYMGCFYMMHDITAEREQQEKYRYMATHDALTGIYNRSYFMEKAEEFMKENPQEEFLIICSDIRQFKMINEIFGQETGDRILSALAEDLRNEDDHERVYGRIAADTFAMCIPSKNFNTANYLMRGGSVLHIKDINFPIVNHIGIYEVEDINMPVASMCDRAMLAISMIKDNVQQEIMYYDDRLRKELLREQEILKDLTPAFEQNQFVIYIQPQFNHRTGDIVGGEVLVRWIHPSRGIVPPKVFIPMMELRGLVSKLDRYVWAKTCELLKKYKEQGRDISLSVNISPKDLFYFDLYREFMNLVREYEISPSRIKLEITETAIMMDVPKQVALIEKLQAEGFIVEMDDFGSGYSSLNTLKDIPVDVLKLDMKFMAKSKNPVRSADIIQMVIAMADKLHMPVIAEGVETKEQADFLSQVGCDMIQGYYYAKPVTVTDFEELLEQYPYKDIEIGRLSK